MEPESQIHAFPANHSCEVPHDAQNELLKNTGIEANLARSMNMPVEMGFPVLGQRIMTEPIQFSLTISGVAYG